MIPPDPANVPNAAITFRPVSAFPRGTLTALLDAAYAFDPRCAGAWRTEWVAFDDFFSDRPALADRCGFLTCLDGEPVGLVSWDPRGLPERVEIGHNCIIPRFRGRGYGALQMREALRRIALRDVRRITVTTSALLVPAQRMYERVGFRPVRRRPHNHFSGDLLDYEYAPAILRLYLRLLAHYGEQHWWTGPGDTRWKIAAGMMLVQNCAWRNVEQALARLDDAGLTTPDAVLRCPDETLRHAIRPAGCFHRKSACLKDAARFFRDRGETAARTDDGPELRRQLLAINGIGRETADAIALYAFRRPVFVIDACTRRVAERHLCLDGGVSGDALQKTFMDVLPPDVRLYGEYHALLIAFGQDSCRKSGCGTVCRTLFGPNPSTHPEDLK